MIDISGYLSEFSLAEVFQFLEQGNKTGLLYLKTNYSDNTKEEQNYYVWFRQGRIITSANSLDGQGLLRLIEQRGFLSSRLGTKMSELCPPETPLGLYFKGKEVLDADHLKMLFSIQVIRSVCALFSMPDAKFEFDTSAPIPYKEMTGLSSPATEVTLAGLRALRDWDALTEKLPQPGSALMSMIEGKPEVSISQTEWQVWEYTKGNMSLEQIAKELRLPLEKVQQIAFRLIIISLAQEVPVLVPTFQPEAIKEKEKASSFGESSSPEKVAVTSSFLEGLLGFLRTRR